MTAMQLRPITGDDRAAVRALCLAALDPADTVDLDYLEAVLWDAAEVGGVAATDTGGMLGVIFGSVGPDEDGTIAGAVTLLAVAEPHRRTGVGTALLQQLERRLAAAGAVMMWSGGGQPRFWWPGVDESDSATLQFFEQCGYTVDDDAVNMTVDLGRADLAIVAPDGIILRRATPREWPAFLRWMEATWDDPWGDEVSTTLRRDPTSCFVATRDGDYLGFAAYDTNRRGWFGPMGSRPEARGTGIGRALLKLCLKDYVDRGDTSCEIGWVGPVDFYANAVGAVPGRRFLRLRRELAQ